MINLIGCIAVLLWILVGGVTGQHYYRKLRDREGYRPWPALGLAATYGIASPVWLLLVAVWNIISVGLVRKK